MKKVLEIAVYELKKEITAKDFEQARAKVKAFVHKCPGFISLITFSDLKQENIRLDYVYWESLEQAMAAAEAFESDPQTREFGDQIEKPIHFGHFTPDKEEIFQASDFSSDSVLEFAIAEVKSESVEAMHKLKPKLFKLVKSQKGLRKITSAESLENEAIIFDALCWDNMNDLTSAIEIIHKDESCKAFMETFKEDVYFGYLQILPDN